jgi:cytochrome c biogenesis protein ResB
MRGAPAVDPQVASAIAQAKEAFEIERAVDEARAAFAADLAREIEEERLRLSKEIRQREQAEAAQKLEQERGQSWGMEI